MNNTSDDKPGAIQLVIKGLHVPSFKNRKMIARRRLITAPREQRLMEVIVENLRSQLLSLLATNETEMQTGCIPLSRIACSVPCDDCLEWIPEHCVRLRRVSKGSEGAEIVIERL